MALSTIGTAAIADDAITAAKIDDDGTGFTFGDVTTGALTATGATTGIVTFDKLTLDGSSVATVTVNSAVSSSATVVVDGVSGTIAVGMVVNVSDTTVRSIIDASSETAVSVDDTLTITAVASQTSFTVSEAVSIADNVVLILRADESSKMVLDASAASTDVGDEILFEDATNDGSISLSSNPEIFKGTTLAVDTIQPNINTHVNHTTHSSFIAHTPNNGDADAILVFTLTIDNEGNDYSTSTGLYTAPVKGLYSFSFSLLLYGTSNTGNHFHKNGVDIGIIIQNSSEDGNFVDSSSATLFIHLEANDTMGVFNKGSSNEQVHESNKTWWSGGLVR